MKAENFKELVRQTMGDGVFESWGAEPQEQTNEAVLSFVVNGLLLRGIVVIQDTEKEKYYRVTFYDEQNKELSTHTSSKSNLPKLIDQKVERAKEWSDEEYRQIYLEKAKKDGLKDLYTAMDAVRCGHLESVMLFSEKGEPLVCTKEGNYIQLRNMTTNEIILKQEITK